MKPKKNTESQWLAILKDALDNNIKIAMNHKYEYKGHRLGSFLVHAKKRKKKDLYHKIEALGFNYKFHSKKPIDIVESFIHELWNDPNPFKGKYITKFNHYIIPKKKLISRELKDEINVVWKLKFGEKRVWKKPTTYRQRVNFWKKVRYDKELNPEEKWYCGTSKLKPNYYWVRLRKLSKDRMNEIVKYFNEQELAELEKEGFQFDNPYSKKPKYKRIKKEDKAKKRN